jgi:hypothetical protein
MNGRRVHLSYNTMASILAFYRSSMASNVANSLDKKIKPLVVKKRPPSERWDHLMLLSSRTMLITIEGYFRDTGDGRLREL